MMYRGISNSSSSSSRRGGQTYSERKTSNDESLPTLREDEIYQEDKENRIKRMSATNVQQFWSALSVHAASTALNIGGEKVALAAASSLLEDGEMMLHINAMRRKQKESYASSYSIESSIMKKPKQEMNITPQMIQNAASKASIAMLQKSCSDPQVASAVAVAIIEKGTELLHTMNEQRLDQTNAHMSTQVLAMRPTHDHSSRKSIKPWRGGKNNVTINNMEKIQRSDLQKNPLDDNNTIGSISTIMFKMWDKYATEKDYSEWGKNSANNSLNKLQFSESTTCDESSSQSIVELSQYSTDLSTIETESYHCLRQSPSPRTKEETLISKHLSVPRESNSYSGEKEKELERKLAEFVASEETSNFRQKKGEIECKHAEMSKQLSTPCESNSDTAAIKEKELERKRAAFVVSAEAKNFRQIDEELERKHAEFSAAASALQKKLETLQLALNKLDSTDPKTTQVTWSLSTTNTSANEGDNNEESLSLNASLTRKKTRDHSHFRSILKKTSTSFCKVEHKHDQQEDKDGNYFSYDEKNAVLSSPDDEYHQTTSIEVALMTKTFKDKVKAVTWAATNALKRIPARSSTGIKSAKRRVSRALRRRHSLRRRRGCRLKEEHKNTIDSTPCEMAMKNKPQARSNSDAKKSSSKSNSNDFLYQPFYVGPFVSDEETVVSMFTNECGAQSCVEAVLDWNSVVNNDVLSVNDGATDNGSYATSRVQPLPY